MTTRVKQIIGYKIQDGKENEFSSIKEQMISESYTLNGLYSSVTSKSLDEDSVYIDTMIWESKEIAMSSLEHFVKLPTANKFLELMTGPPLFQYMMEYVEDKIQE